MVDMNVIRFHQFGGPEVLNHEQIPIPEPEADEVLIKVHAAGVNPVDWKIREGYFKDYRLPAIPGWDVAGTVERTGKNVTDWNKGDAVYSRPDIQRDGTYAEYIVVRASEIAAMPKSLDFVHAAAVPLAALTAWQSLFDEGQLQPGQKVLIHAAAGGVGHFAVQLAKWKGAHVVATASSYNHRFLRDLGADETIDYRQTPFENVVRDADLVLDTIAGDTQKRSWKTLKKGGIQVSILKPPPEDQARAHNARAGFVFVKPSAEQLNEIASLIDDGTVTPVVTNVLPLEHARLAQHLSQTGHVRGKIVLNLLQ